MTFAINYYGFTLVEARYQVLPNTANFLIETKEESPCSCMRGPPIPKKETLEFKVFIFRINWAPCKSPEASPAIK